MDLRDSMAICLNIELFIKMIYILLKHLEVKDILVS